MKEKEAKPLSREVKEKSEHQVTVKEWKKASRSTKD